MGGYATEKPGWVGRREKRTKYKVSLLPGNMVIEPLSFCRLNFIAIIRKAKAGIRVSIILSPNIFRRVQLYILLLSGLQYYTLKRS